VGTVSIKLTGFLGLVGLAFSSPTPRATMINRTLSYMGGKTPISPTRGGQEFSKGLLT